MKGKNLVISSYIYDKDFCLSTDSPENVRLILTRSGPSATITCTAEARPEPSYKILLNETILVISGKTFIIPEVNSSHVGYYKCVAMNFLGNASSHPKYLSIGTNS